MNSPAGTALNATVSQLAAKATELLAVLREECDALKTSSARNFDALLERKQALLQTIESLEAMRQDSMRARGLSPDPVEFRALLADSAGTDTARQSWDTALGALEQCQQQNLTNGAMLQLRHRFTAEALGILRGTPLPSVYSSQGRLDDGESGSRTYHLA